MEEGSRLLSWSRGLIDNGLMNPSMGLWDMVLVRSFFLEAAISERRLVMLSQPCSSEWCGRTATGGSMKEVLAIVRLCGRVEPSLWATGAVLLQELPARMVVAVGLRPCGGGADSTRETSRQMGRE